MAQQAKRTSARTQLGESKTARSDTSERLYSDEMGLERLVFFSDAVFAIAITLLALEIRLPGEIAHLTNDQLRDQLLALGPKYLSYCISFFVIGTFWISHHRKFRFIAHYDMRLLLLNLTLLLVVAFIPFPTSVLSENGNRTATIFYALTMVVVGAMATLIWWYAVQNNRLVSEDFTDADRRRGFVSSLIAPIIFLISIGIAFVNADAAKYFWLLIAPASIFLH